MKIKKHFTKVIPPYTRTAYLKKPSKDLSQSDVLVIPSACVESSKNDPRKELLTYDKLTTYPFPGTVFADRDETFDNKVLAGLMERLKATQRVRAVSLVTEALKKHSLLGSLEDSTGSFTADPWSSDGGSSRRSVKTGVTWRNSITGDSKDSINRGSPTRGSLPRLTRDAITRGSLKRDSVPGGSLGTRGRRPTEQFKKQAMLDATAGNAVLEQMLELLEQLSEEGEGEEVELKEEEHIEDLELLEDSSSESDEQQVRSPAGEFSISVPDLTAGAARQNVTKTKESKKQKKHEYLRKSTGRLPRIAAKRSKSIRSRMGILRRHVTDAQSGVKLPDINQEEPAHYNKHHVIIIKRND